MNTCIERVMSPDRSWFDRVGIELWDCGRHGYRINYLGTAWAKRGRRRPRSSWHQGFVAAKNHFNRRLAALGLQRPANRFQEATV